MGRIIYEVGCDGVWQELTGLEHEASAGRIWLTRENGVFVSYHQPETFNGAFIRAQIVDEPAAQQPDEQGSSAESAEVHPADEGLRRLLRAQQRLEQLLQVARDPASRPGTSLSSVVSYGLAEECADLAEELEDLSRHFEANKLEPVGEMYYRLDYGPYSPEDIAFLAGLRDIED